MPVLPRPEILRGEPNLARLAHGAGRNRHARTLHLRSHEKRAVHTGAGGTLRLCSHLPSRSWCPRPCAVPVSKTRPPEFSRRSSRGGSPTCRRIAPWRWTQECGVPSATAQRRKRARWSRVPACSSAPNVSSSARRSSKRKSGWLTIRARRLPRGHVNSWSASQQSLLVQLLSEEAAGGQEADLRAPTVNICNECVPAVAGDSRKELRRRSLMFQTCVAPSRSLRLAIRLTAARRAPTSRREVRAKA